MGFTRCTNRAEVTDALEAAFLDAVEQAITAFEKNGGSPMTVTWTCAPEAAVRLITSCLSTMISSRKGRALSEEEMGLVLTALGEGMLGFLAWKVEEMCAQLGIPPKADRPTAEAKGG